MKLNAVTGDLMYALKDRTYRRFKVLYVSFYTIRAQDERTGEIVSFWRESRKGLGDNHVWYLTRETPNERFEEFTR